MKVMQIVSYVAAMNTDEAKVFYESILGLSLIMDHGWIKTCNSDVEMRVQISVASEGGSGTTAPDQSIEVDDLDTVLDRMIAENIKIEYGPVSEPWGVHRFFVQDPFGKLINVLMHE